MKASLLLLVLIMFLSMLNASDNYYQQQIDQAKIQLAYKPLDNNQRLGLAYLYMMNLQPELALAEYRLVRERDPESKDAAAGMLWALNSLQRWQETITEADSILSALSSDPNNKEPLIAEHKGLILYHLASAEAALQRSLSSRSTYMSALSLSKQVHKDLIHNGLAWAYLSLDDYPNAAKQLSLVTQPSPAEIFKPAFTIEPAIAFKDSSGTILSLGTSYKYRSTSFRLKAEEIMISGKHFRYNIHGSLRKQLPYLDLRLGLQYLDGDDQRIYPGRAVSMSIQPRFYLGRLGFKTSISQYISVYERFNVYQSDLGLELRTDPVSLSATLSKVIQDNESIGADTDTWVISANASSRIYRNIYLGLYAGWGEMAWHTTPFGDITDDFTPGESYYGFSLSAPLFNKLSIMFYEQLGYNESKLNPLSLLRLVYAI